MTAEDVQNVYDEVINSKPQKQSYFKTLFYLQSLCKRDKEMKLKQKAVSRFEEHLDIRSFLSVYTNLALLIKVLLSK